MVGPNFDAGARRIGRERLPSAFVAITADPLRLLAAITELHAYALSHPPGKANPLRGIVFRTVAGAELQRFNYKL